MIKIISIYDRNIGVISIDHCTTKFTRPNTASHEFVLPVPRPPNLRDTIISKRERNIPRGKVQRISSDDMVDVSRMYMNIAYDGGEYEATSTN